MALKKLSTFRILVVFLVWLGAMGLLFKREIYPSLVPGENRIGRLEELSPALVRDQWMGIYYRDRQVGYSHTALFPHKEDGFYGSALENTLWLDLPLPGRSSRVRLHSRVLIDTSGTIERIGLEASSTQPPLRLVAGNRDGLLEVTINAAGRKRTISFPFTQKELPLYSLGPFLAFRDLEAGETFAIDALDPLSSLTGTGFEPASIRFRVREETADGWILETQYGGITLDLRLNRNGELLRVSTPLGWELVRQPHKEVMEFLKRKGEEMRGSKVRSELK